MTSRLALAAVLLTLAAPARAQVVSTEESDLGTTWVMRFRSAPFPHRATRPQYRDDRVLVFRPAGYRPEERVDVVVHYHGHRAETVSSAKLRALREQLVASGKAAILLCPQGPLRASDSAGGKHEEKDGLRTFLEEAIERLADEGVVSEGTPIGRVILSGHSGGYRVIARAIVKGGVDVREVWLHDAVYAEVETFARWAAADESRRLVSTHTPKGGTRGHNGTLRARLAELRMPVVTVDDDDAHASARAVVVAAPETHDQVTHLHRRFERFLRTSVLVDLDREPSSRGLVDTLPGR